MNTPPSKSIVSLSRRRLLRGLFLTGSVTALAPLLKACKSGAGGGASGGGVLSIPAGPLSNIGPLGAPDGDAVAAPEGFAVRAVARAGAPPATGSPYSWHIFPDGGATYPRDNGGWIYTCNSEVPGGGGGCGALVFDPDGTVVDAYSILSGTSTNCAGGKTPWLTWLSCEEDANGHVWETDPYGLVGAVEKPALGTFAHEAAVIDPIHHVVYLTEDEGNGRFYRWLADASDVDSDGRLAMQSGRLQVMNIEGFENGGYPEDVGRVRGLRGVNWVDVVRPGDPQATVRDELAAAGESVPGTRFAGGEGLWYYELPAGARRIPDSGRVPTRGLVFFATKGDNRVWALDIENQLVEVIFDNAQIEPGFSDVDNITVSPWGDILVAEDQSEAGRAMRIMVLVPNQPAKVLVEIHHPGSEICGPAFNPDGSRLYFSSQRGPEVPGGQTLVPDDAPGSGFGATYELTIPEQFRGR